MKTFYPKQQARTSFLDRSHLREHPSRNWINPLKSSYDLFHTRLWLAQASIEDYDLKFMTLIALYNSLSRVFGICNRHRIFFVGRRALLY